MSTDAHAPAGGLSITIRPRAVRSHSPLARWYRDHERPLLGAAGLIGFCVFWQVGAYGGFVDPFFFSSPLAILEAASAEVLLPRFWTDVRLSALEFTIGFLAALVLAVPLGILIGWYHKLSLLFDPWLNFFNALPRIALLPLVVLWVGLGVEMKALMVFLGGFFSIIVPTVEGVRTVDRKLLDVARSFGARQRLTFTSIVVPATIPFIVTGIRLAVGQLLIGVILAELYAQSEGLGVMIAKAENALQSDRMLFGVLIFTLAGVVLTEGVGIVERYLQRWRPSREFGEAR